MPEDESGIDEAMRRQMEERDVLKNIIGNLTLLTRSANPSLSNGGFADKKTRLRQSLLKMNQAIASRDLWDERAILARAASLGELAVRIWPAPAAAAEASIKVQAHVAE